MVVSCVLDYVGSLRDGIFIVADGQDRDEAVANARTVVDENRALLEASALEAGVGSAMDLSDACRLVDIGPVAVLPRP